MSGPAAIQATFINRRTNQEYTSLPVPNAVTYNTDMRMFTDSFDFEVRFARDVVVDILSHDFVEYYFTLDGKKFQIGVGFLETCKSQASAEGYVLRGNGRDLLGQLIDIPFKRNLRQEQMSISRFLQTEALKDSYINEYLSFRNRSNQVVDRGAYKGVLQFATTAEVKRGSVVQEYADLAMNEVYLDRMGRPTIYGRANSADLQVPQTLSHEGDLNVIGLIKTDDFSKVYSEVTIAVVQAELNLDNSNLKSRLWKNTDTRVSHVYRPYYKTYGTADLVKTGGTAGVELLQERLAKSIIRKGNQNIGSVVIRAAQPYYVAVDGSKLPYEVGQNWSVKSTAFQIDKQMKLVGIGYRQEPGNLDVQLAFVEPDTVV